MSTQSQYPITPYSAPTVAFYESLNSYKTFRTAMGECPLTATAQITYLNARGRDKSLLVLLPVRIRHGEALPEHKNCVFTVLALHRQLPTYLQKKIETMSIRKRETLAFQLRYWFPNQLIDSLIDEHQWGVENQSMFNASLDTYISQIVSLHKTVKATRNDPECLLAVKYNLSINVIQADSAGAVRNSLAVSAATPHIPAKQILRWYCKRMHQWFYPYLSDMVDGEKDRIDPSHRGWITVRSLPYYIGMPTPLAGFHLLPLSDLLCSAPYEITLPLFSYALFSVLKFFISGYPSRMCDRDAYRSVVAKLKKAVFLSADGEDACAYANAFCGGFQESPLPYSKAQGQSASRVHDGVVIYGIDGCAPHEISDWQLPSFLIHDASSLFISANLPKNSNGMIHMSILGHKPLSPDISHSVTYYLSEFVKWVEHQYQHQAEYAKKEVSRKIVKCFLKHYNRIRRKYSDYFPQLTAETLLGEMKASPHQFGELDSLLQAMIWTLYRHFEDLDERLWDICKQHRKTVQNVDLPPNSVNATGYDKLFPASVCRLAMKKPPKFPALTSTMKKAPTLAAYEYSSFICESRRICNAQQKTLNINIINYGAALKTLKSKFGARPSLTSRYAYLLAAFSSFLDFYSETDYALAEQLRTQARNTFQSLCCQDGSDKLYESSLETFSGYLSNQITQNRVIAVRTEPPSGITPVGWYDPKTNQIYLPYQTYFEAFCSYCHSQKFSLQLPSKRLFQENALYPHSIVSPKPNGMATSYVRPDCQVVVAPVQSSKMPKQAVIKINLAELERIAPLAPPSKKKLEQLSSISVPRRSLFLGGSLPNE